MTKIDKNGRFRQTKTNRFVSMIGWERIPVEGGFLLVFENDRGGYMRRASVRRWGEFA